MDIIIKPIITEGSMKDAANGKFTFQVDAQANKMQIKSEIEKLFSVNVKGVSTVTQKRRKVISTRFGVKKTSSYTKKARVLLAKGQTIPAFETKEDKKVKEKKKGKTE